MINEICYEEVRDRLRDDLRLYDELTLERVNDQLNDIRHMWETFKHLHARIEACEKMVTSYSVGVQNVYNEFKMLEEKYGDLSKVIHSRKIINRLRELKEIFSE
jgi:hypothetical protein